MENNLDLNNADKLDSYQEEEILEYSNFDWKDPLAGAKEAAKKAKQEAERLAKKAKEEAERIAKQAQEKAKKAKEEAERIAKQAQEKAKKAKEEAERIAKKAKEQAKAAGKNIEQTTKEALKSTKDQLKAAGKNIKTTAKELSDKAKKAMKKLLGKAVLGMTYTAIRSNQLGIATRLYPAIANGQEIKASKFKPSFVPKSKMSYAEILKKWKENGGKEEKLIEAIRKGAKVRFGKPKKKLSFNGTEYYSFNASDYYNATGEELTSPEVTENVTNVTVTPEETAAIVEETGSNEVVEEQKVSGWNKFLAFIMNIFKKNKASDEIPYEEGSAEATSYSEDLSAVSDDIANIESFDASGDIDLDDDLPVSDVKRGADDKILGMSKGTAIAVGVGLVLLTVGGIYLYKKYGKK